MRRARDPAHHLYAARNNTTADRANRAQTVTLAPLGCAESDLADRHRHPPHPTLRPSPGPTATPVSLPAGQRRPRALLCLHHITFDRWSGEILLRELDALYQDACTGRQSSLPPLPIQYADYARWQREQLTPDRLEQLLTYWRAQLAGAPALIPLPTDFPRPARQSFRGGTVSTSLPAGDLQALRSTSARHGTTVFTTLLTVFQAVLARYCGTSDIVIGTPITQRTRPELGSVIGYFLNILPLRTDLTGNPTVAEALAQTTRTVHKAIAHQDLPFELLVRALQPTRSLAYEPLVQVLINHAQPRPQQQALGPLSLSPLEPDYASAKYDLRLATAERPDSLLITIDYATDLFAPQTMERFLSHLTTLLRAMLADDRQRIEQIDFLHSKERTAELITCNQTARSYPGPLLLHDAFSAQVTRTPQTTAVISADETLTYAELDRRANRLARYLQARGVGPDVPVGVCLERSLDLSIGLWAILKAGGTYVPLDPSYPPARLDDMLAQAAPALVLYHGPTAVMVTAGAQQAINLSDPAAPWHTLPDTAPPTCTGPDHLAYIIFTSGSTGRPKGCMISHRAVANRLAWMQEQYNFTTGDRTLQKTPISFDVSLWELTLPHLTGATLVYARPGGHRIPPTSPA